MIPFGSSPFDRFVEDQHLRVTEQCCGEPETLSRTQREAASTFVGDVVKSDEIEHLPNTSGSDPLGLSERESKWLSALRRLWVVPGSSNGVTTEEGR